LNKQKSRTTLPRRLRASMQDYFGESFVDVEIVVGASARRLTSALNTIACTDGHRLYFAPGCYQPDDPRGRLLIAHELAHVVQKRRALLDKSTSRSGVPDSLLEVEADAAAWRAVQEKATLPLSPDATSRMRCWGPAGHYYTCYFAGLAAGFTEEQVARSAFFCQMPDQVADFDAVVAGKAWAAGAVLPVLFGPAHTMNIRARMPSMLNVQYGLHCLTGRPSDFETRVRTDVLKSLQKHVGSPTFGLALHAYGDSFAHRRRDDESTMYQGPYGHLCDGHTADEIGLRGGLYHSYATSLFAVLSDIARKNGLTPALDSGEYVTAINSFSTQFSQEPQQIAAIRAFCAKNLQKMREYAPETAEADPIPWNDFYLRYSLAYQLNAHVLSRVQYEISDWSRL
jgi:Domain of unknown function (DUF4157)